MKSCTANINSEATCEKGHLVFQHTTASSQMTPWFIYATFFVFPIALLPKVAQLSFFCALLMAIVVVFRRRLIGDISFESTEGLLFCFISIYLLSILSNSAGAAVDRILAAFNTWLTWVVAALIYSVCRFCSLDRRRVAKIALVNIVILIALSMLHFIGAQIHLPLVGRVLSDADWINGTVSKRLCAFLEYPTLVAAMYFMLFPISLEAVINSRRRILPYAYCLAAAVPVIACGSRTGILLCVVSTLVSLFYVDAASGNSRISGSVKLLLVLLAIGCVFILFHNEIVSGAKGLIDSRQGSTDTRQSLYEYSLRRVMDESPVFGCGIKDVVVQFGPAVPVGSHSTYIGILYRTGIVGFLIFMSALLLLIKRIVLSEPKGEMRVYRLIFVLLFCSFFVTEDIDGADWLLVSALAVAGFLTNCTNVSLSPIKSATNRWRCQ